MADKAGFTWEGRLRCSHGYGGGPEVDRFLWARPAEDPAPSFSSRS